MNVQNKDQWEDAFIKSCKEGDLEGLKWLCGQEKFWDWKWVDVHADQESGFLEACRHGHLNVVRFLLTSPEIRGHGVKINLHRYEEYGLELATQEGHLDVMKYLLTSQELIEAGYTFADLEINKKEWLNALIRKCDIQIIQFVLTSKELVAAGHALVNVHEADELLFRGACYRGKLDVIKYLLNEKWEEEINVHAINDRGLMSACEEGHDEVVKYLLTWEENRGLTNSFKTQGVEEQAFEKYLGARKRFNGDESLGVWWVMDHGLERTPRIEEIIKKYPQAMEWFRAREEKMELGKPFGLEDYKGDQDQKGQEDKKIRERKIKKL